AQAEDVAVVNLLVKETEVPGPFHNTFAALPNLLAFSGQQFALSVPGYGVAVNTLNGHPELGNLGLLNCHRVVYPLTFGGPRGKQSNGTVLGVMRTYAQVSEEFSYKTWIEAVRAGRTFVTNGPLLFLSVNDQQPTTAGIEVHAGEVLGIRAEAQSRFPFE